MPLSVPEESLKELERCIEDLGFWGIAVGTNVMGVPIDNEVFWPLFEAASSYGIIVHVHPRSPRDGEVYKEFRLAPMIGFETELCITVARLILRGVLECYQNLKLIISHLGGGILFLADRVERCFRVYPECSRYISVSPGFYLKNLYYDTVNFLEPALMMAYNVVGPDHLVFGSDYPHVLGDIYVAVDLIQRMSIPQSEKSLIYFENLLRLVRSINGNKTAEYPL